MSAAENAVVLFYHRFSDEPTDLFELSVSPDHFSAHVDVIRSMAEIVPLSRIVDEAGPRVAITFDDGYANGFTGDLHEALRDISVTLFVVTGKIGANRGFWWDELEQMMLGSRVFPSSVEATIGGRSLWVHTATRAGRERAGLALQSRLVGLSQSEIERHVDDLRSRTDIAANDHQAHRSINEDELRALSALSNVEIGAHTVTHPALDVLSLAEQRREIEESKLTLSAIVGDITSFAYPFGRFSDQGAELVRQAGFENACTTIPAPVKAGVDPFRLPRNSVGNWSREEFSRRLSNWLSEP